MNLFTINQFIFIFLYFNFTIHTNIFLIMYYLLIFFFDTFYDAKPLYLKRKH